MIGIVNYGLGNVSAFARIFHRLNVPFCLAGTRRELETADKIILPGVGAFDWAVEKLHDAGLAEPLRDLVLGERRPFLGVCIGMQLMAERSDEGERPGLGWIQGEVERLNGGPTTMLPHMGWNDVLVRFEDPLFEGLHEAPRFYFLHSFHVSPLREQDILATADYEETFVCSVRVGNMYGVQFHPEKSHESGVRLLRNFAQL